MKNLSLILCALLLLVSITGCNFASALAPEAPVNGTEGETEGTESAATESETVEPESETITTETETEPEEDTEEVEIVHVYRQDEDFELFTGEDGNRYIRYRGGEYEVFDSTERGGWRHFFLECAPTEENTRYTAEDGKRYIVLNGKHYEIFVDETQRHKGYKGEYYKTDYVTPTNQGRVYLGYRLNIPYEGDPFVDEELSKTIDEMFSGGYKLWNYQKFDSYERYYAEDGTEYISYEGNDYKVFTSKDGGKYFLLPSSFRNKIRCKDKDGNRYIVWTDIEDLVFEEKYFFEDGIGYYEIPEKHPFYGIEAYKYFFPAPEEIEEGKSYILADDKVYEIEEPYATGKTYRILSDELYKLYYDETKEALGYEYTVYPNNTAERKYLAIFCPISGGDLAFESDEMFSRLGISRYSLVELSKHSELFTATVMQKVLNVIKDSVPSDVHVSIDSNGKILSNKEYTLPQEAIEKVVNIYYDALDMGLFWEGAEMYKMDYHKDIFDIWMCWLDGDGFMLSIMVGSNGELKYISHS